MAKKTDRAGIPDLSGYDFEIWYAIKASLNEMQDGIVGYWRAESTAKRKASRAGWWGGPGEVIPVLVLAKPNSKTAYVLKEIRMGKGVSEVEGPGSFSSHEMGQALGLI